MHEHFFFRFGREIGCRAVGTCWAVGKGAIPPSPPNFGQNKIKKNSKELLKRKAVIAFSNSNTYSGQIFFFILAGKQ